MNRFSLKWKLSISFVALSLGLVSVYIILAKQTFEFDKISYIFESQQREVGLQSTLFRTQIEQALFETKTLLQAVSKQGREEGAFAQKLLLASSKIFAIEILKSRDSALIFQSAKPSVSLEKLKSVIAPAENEKYVLQHLSEDFFGLSIQDKLIDGTPVIIRLLCQFRDALPAQKESHIFLMTQGLEPIRTPGLSEDLAKDVSEALNKLGNLSQNSTHQVMIGTEEYLLSMNQSGVSNISFLSLVNQKQALSAMGLLLKRSVIFVLFSGFATVILSILLSNRLTQNINSLTETASEISKGHFEAKPGFTSNDEVGVLARAFEVMAKEIERLIGQVIEKTRMEEELKTASLVQENLFPAKATYTDSRVSLSGMNLSSTECSGDWWYYFPKNQYVYAMIGDATGHGTPAALITAVARSVFSVIENNPSDLVELGRSWDRAVRDCSKGSLFMTAFILELNLETGDARYVNSSHELPVLMKYDRASGKAQSEMLDCPVNHRLGELKDKWTVGSFKMEKSERLVIYTDGFYTLNDENGRTLNDRRWMKLLEKECPRTMGTADVVSTLSKLSHKFAAGKPFEDDITLLVIDRLG